MSNSIAYTFTYYQASDKSLNAILAVTDGTLDVFSAPIIDCSVMAAVETMLELADANHRSCRTEIGEAAALESVDTMRALFWQVGALPGTGRSHDIGLDALLPKMRSTRFAAEVLIDDCVTALRERRGCA